MRSWRSSTPAYGAYRECGAHAAHRLGDAGEAQPSDTLDTGLSPGQHHAGGLLDLVRRCARRRRSWSRHAPREVGEDAVSPNVDLTYSRGAPPTTSTTASTATRSPTRTASACGCRTTCSTTLRVRCTTVRACGRPLRGVAPRHSARLAADPRAAARRASLRTAAHSHPAGRSSGEEDFACSSSATRWARHAARVLLTNHAGQRALGAIQARRCSYARAQLEALGAATSLIHVRSSRAGSTARQFLQCHVGAERLQLVPSVRKITLVATLLLGAACAPKENAIPVRRPPWHAATS